MACERPIALDDLTEYTAHNTVVYVMRSLSGILTTRTGKPVVLEQIVFSKKMKDAPSRCYTWYEVGGVLRAIQARPKKDLAAFLACPSLVSTSFGELKTTDIFRSTHLVEAHSLIEWLWLSSASSSDSSYSGGDFGTQEGRLGLAHILSGAADSKERESPL